jgi:hypothetical protein
MMRRLLLTFVAILSSIGSGCGHLDRAVSTSDGAQTSTGNLAAKIVDLLPPRWSCIESNGTIIVTRDAAVRFINLINAPARLPTETQEAYYLAHSYLCHYRISINSEPRLSQSEVDDVRRENEKVSQTLFKLRAKMNHIAHKFDSYSTLDPEKAKLVQEYENTKKRLRRSPRYYCGDQTVYVSIEPDGPWADVMSADVRDECTTVLSRIQDLFKRYAE